MFLLVYWNFRGVSNLQIITEPFTFIILLFVPVAIVANVIFSTGGKRLTSWRISSGAKIFSASTSGRSFTSFSGPRGPVIIRSSRWPSAGPRRSSSTRSRGRPEVAPWQIRPETVRFDNSILVSLPLYLAATKDCVKHNHSDRMHIVRAGHMHAP